MRENGFVSRPKQPITTAAPKYGPTGIYGHCEVSGCRANARTTCETCDGHYCLGHAEHPAHTTE